MVIYLTHFLHGAKVAISDMEAESDEQNGWVRYNPDTLSEPEEAVNTLIVAKRKYTRKAADPSEVTTEGV
jgi:hypothetical protein